MDGCITGNVMGAAKLVGALDTISNRHLTPKSEVTIMTQLTLAQDQHFWDLRSIVENLNVLLGTHITLSEVEQHLATVVADNGGNNVGAV